MEKDNAQNLRQGSLPLTAGSQLRAAREAAGLSRADIASRTKIAERHLIAIEEDRFGDLAARTYAVGFARAYARVLGLDETEVAAAVHSQIDAEDIGHHEAVPSFEPGDPARVPPVRLAWLGAAGAVVVIALVLLFWNSFLSPEGKLPDLLPSQAPTPVASASSEPAPAAPEVPDGQVVLTATDDGVWLRVTDEGGEKLFERQLAKGESWTVPESAKAPQLRTRRPDALQLTVGGKAIPALADSPRTVSGISLIAADLVARTEPAPSRRASRPSPTPKPTPAPKPTPMPTPTATQPRPRATASQPAPAPTATRTPSVRETTRPTATRSPSASAAQPTSTPTPRPSVTPTATPSARVPAAAPVATPRPTSAPAASDNTTSSVPVTPAPLSTDSE
jgi:cytoskeletal protein RodZ